MRHLYMLILLHAQSIKGACTLCASCWQHGLYVVILPSYVAQQGQKCGSTLSNLFIFYILDIREVNLKKKIKCHTGLAYCCKDRSSLRPLILISTITISCTLDESIFKKCKEFAKQNSKLCIVAILQAGHRTFKMLADHTASVHYNSHCV